MKSLIWLGAFLWIFSLVQVPSSKEWRGLTPLASTRADVERVLWKADVNHQNQVWIYYLSASVVTFNFSGNPNCSQKRPYPSWNIPSNTVTSFGVGLKQQVPITDFGADLTKLKKVKGDFDTPDHFYYINEDDGFSIEVGRGHVMGYIYEPSAKYKDLRCHINWLQLPWVTE